MAGPALSWRLRQLPVCASTEIELERWLLEHNASSLERSGLVVVARRQRHGRGQRGRHWESPAGGLWLSAAFAWPGISLEAAAPLSLAVALGLSLQLETLGLKPQIKWPNDVLINGRKLAGILPRLRLAGPRVRWAQVGLGINGINRIPAGAIALGTALHPGRRQRFDPRATPRALLPRVLTALAWTQQHLGESEQLLQLVNQRLYRPANGWLHASERWNVLDLAADGALRLERNGQVINLQRQELNPADRA